jgi:dTDP-4-amino-4,6-dideoxygalactose transaminase
MRIARIPPTLAVPSVGALGRGCAGLIYPALYRGCLERELNAMFPQSVPIGFASGRAALATALIVAMRATGRRVVVLPAYTSFSVAAAAAVAGARVRLCDLDPTTLDFDRDDLAACVDEQTAAVVLGNLYGYPSDVADLDWVAGRGALLIDDAAQALGAWDRGKPVGSRGQLGVLSFGRGKCATTGKGGALLLQDPALRAHLDHETARTASRGLQELLVALAARLRSNTAAFGLLSRISGGRNGQSVYRPGFAIRGASASSQAMALGLAAAVARRRETRAGVARLWMGGLQETGTVVVITPREESEPAYLRFPVLTADGGARERLSLALARHGFAFLQSYPTTLAAIEVFRRGWCEGRPTPSAQRLAERILALPCHARVMPTRVERASWVLAGGVGPIGEPGGGLGSLASSGA